jgi:hypothetical protein
MCLWFLLFFYVLLLAINDEKECCFTIIAVTNIIM